MKIDEIKAESEVLRITAQIVAAYVQGNSVALSEIAAVMDTVHDKVCQMSGASVQVGRKNIPAVPVEDSITPDYILCLEDGKSFKMLKKHLKTKYDLTPEEYRAKWSLPIDYPMVAPNYAIKRQVLAKASGLGRTR
jgi:predicted transcriptional regulator